ncbi:MAG: DUF1844 domain-containing protein [Deltaproteobacteria bacterium]|nr:DUF1844 domain-containing protein [Deltaproteobacteria bacterium]
MSDAEQRDPQREEPHREEPGDRALGLPEMDFSTFVMSLGTSAMIDLGESVKEDNAGEKNLPLAKQSIDILVMLEEKTRGNLTEEEAHLISELLYDLRLRFVNARG